MARKQPTSANSVVAEAVAFMDLCTDADTDNRSAAMEDLRFAAGDQWPAQIKQQRMLDKRPCLTINKTDTFVRSVVNNMRQQRPRIKVHPVSSGADEARAKVISGLIRHIEVSSNAEAAYDTGADFQVRMGWGFWRILSRYVDENSFDQELYIDRIRDPFTVFFDPASVAPDGSDAERCLILGKMKKADFEKKYPGRAVSSFKGVQTLGDYARKDEIMLAEFYRIESKPAKLCLLSDGSSMWEAELPGEEAMRLAGLSVIDSRESVRKVVKWSKLSGVDELESIDCAGKYIPVVPVYGAELIDEGKTIRFGMVRNLKDPQTMYNFWRTQETEIVALAPKAPWLMAEGQDEGYEDDWDKANTKNLSRLKYKPVQDDAGNMMPPPVRQQPQAIPAASVQAAQATSEDLKAVAGMFDPALGAPGQETSGEMVTRRQAQSDLSNFHFYDNLTRSIRHTGIILLDLIPYYYDTQRVIRIIGEDGVPESVTINEKAVNEVLNDMTIGRYDVVMDTGPGYDTKRQEAAAMMVDMLRVMPQLAQVAGDLILRNMDWPGAADLADRLAMLIPAAQMSKQLPKDMDPQVKQMVLGLMGQLNQAQQALQQLQQEKAAKVFGVQEKENAVTHRQMLVEGAETDRLHIKEAHEDRREERRLGAETAMNTQDNRTSMTETAMTIAGNLEVGHMKAQQHGVPNNNRPTTQ